MKDPCVHVYIGDGKGKTTAAVGLLTRMKGAGFSCRMFQFLKGIPSAECQILENIGVSVCRGTECCSFLFQMSEEERTAYSKEHLEQFHAFRETALKENTDCIVLDEVLDAVETKVLPLEELISFLEQFRDSAEIVLTGHVRIPEVEQYADYLTEMKMIHHPYEKGVPARPGVEY